MYKLRDLFLQLCVTVFFIATFYAAAAMPDIGPMSCSSLWVGIASAFLAGGISEGAMSDPTTPAAIAAGLDDGRAPLTPGQVHCEKCGGLGCRVLGIEAFEICPDCEGSGVAQ